MTDIDEKLGAVWDRLTAGGLHVQAAAVAYQVSVMRSEKRAEEEILGYLRQVDEELDQPVTLPAGLFRNASTQVRRTPEGETE